MKSHGYVRVIIRRVLKLELSPKDISKILFRYVIGVFYDYNNLKRDGEFKNKIFKHN